MKREHLDAGEGRVLEVITAGNPSGLLIDIDLHGGLPIYLEPTLKFHFARFRSR